MALTAFIKSRRVNSRTFSQAVPKHCQWKTDVRIRASSRRQNGSDAGPESFELRAFLQGLRQKQLRWGAAWSIQKRFNQRFCLETMLTEKSSQGYCLQDVAILTQGKSCRRLQPSCQLDLQQLETAYFIWSSSICSRCISHRNYVALTAFIKSRRVNSFCRSLPVFNFVSVYKLTGPSSHFVCERSQVLFQLSAATAGTHQCATDVPRVSV